MTGWPRKRREQRRRHHDSAETSERLFYAYFRCAENFLLASWLRTFFYYFHRPLFRLIILHGGEKWEKKRRARGLQRRLCQIGDCWNEYFCMTSREPPHWRLRWEFTFCYIKKFYGWKSFISAVSPFAFSSPFNRCAPLRPRHLSSASFTAFRSPSSLDCLNGCDVTRRLDPRTFCLAHPPAITDSEDDAKQFHSFIR